MYVSIRHYKMGAGSLDALARRLGDEFAPALGQEPGFRGYLAVDTGDGTVETISVFADEASARRSDELAAEYVADDLADFRLERTERRAGDVLVSRATPAMTVPWRRRTERLRARATARPAPVVVVGATGRTGRLIVERLTAADVPVHAVVRDPGKGRALLPDGVRQFAGDIREAESLAEPLAGAGAVIVATSGGAGQDNSAVVVDYFGTANLVKEAVAAGVELVVYVSSIYASRPDYYQDVEPTSLGWKARAEERVRESGLDYCIVRAGWLTDGPAGEPLALSQGDTGEGRLSRADLADVCAQVLAIPEARGKTFEVVAARGAEARPLGAAVAELKPDGEALTTA
jgi:uncharacterized protein YbjT (DUF2867 family)